jgi:predicted phosphoadenosine phosphosulfate sulfurtransferase
MRVYLKKNVVEAAKDRISLVFDDFKDVIVSVSGGKDSAVLLHLVKNEAKKRDRLPLKLCFLDQEAEWQGTIDLIKKWMYDPEITPLWYQASFKITNNSSFFAKYLHVYDPEKENIWIHPKDTISINQFSEDKLYIPKNFHEALKYLQMKHSSDNCAIFSGVRVEESQNRRYSASIEKYQSKSGIIINGAVCDDKNRGVFRFSPLYDWSYTDIWKYIYDNKIEYNPLYDKMYQSGFIIKYMRVSAICHEIALRDLMKVAQLEPDTWARVSRRLDGANTARVLNSDINTCPDKLPPMFDNWVEYKDYLLDKLTPDIDKEKMRKVCNRLNKFYGTSLESRAIRTQIQSILINDCYGIMAKNLDTSLGSELYVDSKKAK